MVCFDEGALVFVFVEADDVDADVVPFVELFVFCFAGGESVMGVADGGSAPVVADTDVVPFVECHGVPFGV